MGLQEWSDKQVRKADLRHAIEETLFQMRLWQMFKVMLQVTESDAEALDRFDSTLPEYISKLITGLRKTDAQLWGFKGNVSEWTGSEKMVASGKVRWNNDRREVLTLAVTLIEPFEKRISLVLAKLKATHSLFSGLRTVEERISTISPEVKADHQLAQEIRANVLSAIDAFGDNCADHIKHLEDEAICGGLANHSVIEKLKERAEKRVGAIVKTFS